MQPVHLLKTPNVKILTLSFRYPLKVVVDGVYNIKLYPEDGETTTILNIKRGIISALAVPLEEEDKNKNMVSVLFMSLKWRPYIFFNNSSCKNTKE